MSTIKLNGKENSNRDKYDIHWTLISLCFVFIRAYKSVGIAFDFFTSIFVRILAANVIWITFIWWLIWRWLRLVLFLVCLTIILNYSRRIRNILGCSCIWNFLRGFLLRTRLILRSWLTILGLITCLILRLWRITFYLIFEFIVEFILKLLNIKVLKI